MSEQNLHARNIKGDEVYILEVEKGRKGYYCIGCDAEMEGVRSKIVGRKQFFRHIPLDVSQPERTCTFSNEGYRHKKAILYLLAEKRIKVPSLYKFPPKESEGGLQKITSSHYIEAENVSAGLSFYENNLGAVKFGKSEIIEEKNLLFRPDVIFFDKNNDPILLIEIVDKHKIKPDKLAKIRRIGIDTIRINIPSDSLENIYNNFHITNNTKWVYNNAKERTEYLSISKKSGKELSQDHEIERKFFEESFECRKSEISNLIRGIGKSLGSEQFKGSIQDFGSEISRVETNTKLAENELKKRRNGIEKRVQESFRTEERKLELAEEKFREKAIKFYEESERESEQSEDTAAGIENDIRGEETNLEERYRGKDNSLREEEEEVDIKLRLIEENRISSEGIESTTKDLRGKIKSISTEDKQREGIFRKEKSKFFERKRVETENEGKRFELDKDELQERERATVLKLREEFPDGDYKRNPEFAKRARRLRDAREYIYDFNALEHNRKRYRAAWECFKSGAYKNWI